MAGDASAYAALGLEPGADAAAIERAYKTLIKLHHPDREGGDAARASEINRAYRELRGGGATDPLEFNVFPDGREGMRWAKVALLMAVAAGALLLIGPVTRAVAPAAVSQLPLGHVAAAPAASDPMDKPLHVHVIDAAVKEALSLSRSSDEMTLANASRDCQRSFRADPGLKLLDRCVAFDDAVVQLQDRDPLRDQGPFAELAVTGRQWSAASTLSNDYLAIDGRLDQIRLRVEIALAPDIPPIAPATQNIVTD